ncbi:aconitase X [Arhodomonas aquaeolei]|uniref:cis-3-hydroxy-L-proline dehydratase n=1 Tax=Arhodomonas aquaeolei TaxID=2369 RepID=UPI0003752B32|nr:aconitase family protein [Arhodomonas aquaeolei]
MSRSAIGGVARGPVLASDEGLSFWGGVDPATGTIIDAHHPLCGESVAGTVLALPTSRGSCTGSGVLLELIRNGHAPAALVFREPEGVLTLGALVSRHVFDATIPVLQLDGDDFVTLAAAEHAVIDGARVEAPGLALTLPTVDPDSVALSPDDRAMLDGRDGTAVQVAMRIVRDIAAIDGARCLIEVSQVHIDGCIYASPAILRFAEVFAGMQARVRVPTTTNAISVDHAHWREQGVPEAFGDPASRLADAYVQMGARASFTCAPYLLDSAPKAHDVIAWAESNAVIYANSVLGARTAKHPDFLDLCIALTGRAPDYDVYLDENRAARRVLEIDTPAGCDDALWPMLGYLAGLHAPDRIPLLRGLASLSPGEDDLKALCAAFGTTSAAPMLHVEGVTPEAGHVSADADTVRLTREDLARAWRQLNAGPVGIDLVAFGSPHFSLGECRALAAEMAGQHCAGGVTAIVTLGHDTLAAARAEGLVDQLEEAGVRIYADICWCSISEPVFPPEARTLMTNSGKYAHYAPGLSGRSVRFGSLADCALAARTGRAPDTPPAWLG